MLTYHMRSANVTEEALKHHALCEGLTLRIQVTNWYKYDGHENQHLNDHVSNVEEGFDSVACD